MSMRDIDSLTNRIAALLRKAERTPYEEEAASLTAKAQELMARDGIDRAMVDAAGEGGKAPEQVIARQVRLTGTYVPRKATLIHCVAVNLGVKTCLINKHTIELVGTVGDVEWAETLYTSLVAQMESALKVADRERKQVKYMPRPTQPEPHSDGWYELTADERDEAREAWKDYRRYTQALYAGQENGRTFATGFIAGFTNKVANRLRDTRLKAQREAREEAQEAGVEEVKGMELALYNKAERVEAEYKVRHPRVTQRRSASVNSRGGYGAGQNAGSNASFARGGIGGSSRGALGR